MRIRLSGFLVCLTTIFLAGCDSSDESESAAMVEPTVAAGVEGSPASNVAECVDGENIRYLCGLDNPEDALRLGDTQWLLVSGMNDELTGNGVKGKIHLVNHEDKSYQILFPGQNPVLVQNMETFGQCPGPLDITNFSAHGLALQEMGTRAGQYHLYMTSHGAREAIEVFEVETFPAPTIKWVGCIIMPTTSWTNSVVILEDGGFFATQFMDPTGSGMNGVSAGEITGHVFEWHPGEELSILAGTELSGPNGIAMSDDERYLYVAAFGSHEVVRFDRNSQPLARSAVNISIAPDNIHWNSDGTLYTAGGNITEDCPGPDCGLGWSVIEIDPETLAASRVSGADERAIMQGVSSALLVADEIWIGSYGGDRLGILPKP